jgi:uncharacterized protein YbjT (DUF2867 family)
MKWVPHRKVELHLLGSGGSFTLLRPGFFAQNLGDAYRRDAAIAARALCITATAATALRRDPTHPVLVKVDEGLTVEVRAVEAVQPPKRSAADVLREIGRWEEETGDELDALFVRQRSSRQVPDLP